MILKNFVNGVFSDDVKERFDSMNPSTGMAHASLPDSGADQVEAAVAAAKAAFPSWSGTSPKHRSEIMLRIADLIE